MVIGKSTEEYRGGARKAGLHSDLPHSQQTPVEHAARQILYHLGFKTDCLDAQLTELFLDLHRFYSANPQFRDRELSYSDHLSDLVGPKYWGRTQRAHLVELAPYWPEKLNQAVMGRANDPSIKKQKGVQQQETAVQRFSQPSASANQPQGQTPARYLKHDFRIEASAASKQPHQGQSPICHGLPMGIDGQPVPQTNAAPHQSTSGHQEGFSKTRLPFGGASPTLPDRGLVRNSNKTTSLSEELNGSEELRDYIRLTPTRESHEVAHNPSIEGSNNVPEQAQSASGSSYLPKVYAKKSARQSGVSSLQQVEPDTVDISLLASLGPAVVDTSFADIHAHYIKTTSPYIMKLRAIAPHLNPGTQHTVMLADSKGEKPLYGRTATVTSFIYAPNQIISVLRYDEDHSYIVKSLAGGQRNGLRFHRWLGLDKDFASLPSAYKLSESEIASAGMNRSPANVVNEVEEESDSDATLAPLQRACRALDAADIQPSDDAAQMSVEDIPEAAVPITSSKKKQASRNRTAANAASSGIVKTKKSTANTPQSVTASRDPPASVLQTASPLPDILSLTRPGITRASEQPSTTTAFKREHSWSGRGSNAPPPTKSQRLQRSPSLEMTRARQVPKVDDWKQVNTTLHITLSTNDYGAVPVSLSDCMFMNAFIATALSAWGLQDNAAGVAAVSVSFEWLANGLPMFVTKAVENSFFKMLETIDEAPCWENQLGVRAKCIVFVKIIMR
ncbi:MAG: hypothetical protein M1836_007880 [Candelina mexicana]|nr:MAG: hypothetical protein M1836_007880 [Candelina mexicana]